MKQDLALRFLEKFSLLTVGENKRPNFTWAKNQTEKLSIDEFLKRVTYKGGIIKKDGEELPPTKGLGIITGFDYLEVIDVDLKVFSTVKEMQDFWSEYYGTLKESIYDFDNKFAVYKTKSGGYHILYKSKRIKGNTKIASLKGHKEAVIESRGNGGYVFVYPDNKIGTKSYFDVDFITDEDYEILWNVSQSYNYQEPKPDKIHQKTKNYYSEGLTPWQDFNNKNTCLDVVVPDDFDIPTNGIKKKHTLVRRHNATTPHSGYVFADSGCMYLFSTGTKYPHQTLLTPFACYSYKYHNGDFAAATKDLYEQGFGDRLKKEIKKNEPVIIDKPIIENTEFPIEIFPEQLQYYIKECSEKLNMNVDYMGCSLLWLISVVVGNSFEIEVKVGWREKAIVWFALVGKAGIGKTPSIDKIIWPLSKLNNKEIKKYIEEKKKYDEFSKLSKKEQKETYGENYKVNEPLKTQFIVNDITLEALVQMHQQSDNSVGVFKDELAGWLKDMNKYRAGSDLEFWLSTWSGKHVSLNRKTSDSNFVDKPFMPVLGGIQPTIFNSLSTEENKENGFLDRILLAYPEAEVSNFTESDIDYKIMAWYSDLITKFYQSIKQMTVRVDGEIKPNVLKFTDEGRNNYIRIYNEITEMQNSEKENEYLKSIYPKQKSYLPRFCILINVITSFMNELKGLYDVDKDCVLKAEKLCKYFINNAKKVKLDSNETKEIKNIFKDAKTNSDKVKALYIEDPNFNKSKASELLGVSRQYIHNIIKKLENDKTR